MVRLLRFMTLGRIVRLVNWLVSRLSDRPEVVLYIFLGEASAQGVGGAWMARLTSARLK